MHKIINVLDHGYVRLVESWGSDERVIEAARMSTDGGFVSWDPYEGHPKGDAGLLSYLWRNKHATPFEMGGIVIDVQAPIFAVRQWQRHRTQSYNEMSARYTPLPDLDYLPTVERLMQGAIRDTAHPQNRQASKADGARTLDEPGAARYVDLLQGFYRQGQALYETALSIGVPKELARLHLPVARYTRMRVSANLRNWLAFESLRLHPHAQYEIREYAKAVGVFLAQLFPRTWELFHADMPQELRQ